MSGGKDWIPARAVEWLESAERLAPLLSVADVDRIAEAQKRLPRERVPVAVSSCDDGVDVHVTVIANDGTAWVSTQGREGWSQLPPLPKIEPEAKP